MSKKLEDIAKDLDKLFDDTWDFVAPEVHHHHGFLDMIGDAFDYIIHDVFNL